LKVQLPDRASAPQSGPFDIKPPSGGFSFAAISCANAAFDHSAAAGLKRDQNPDDITGS
jgi:hypothetical protein